MKNYLILLSMLLPFLLIGQEDAESLLKQGVKFHDDGEFAKAIEYYEKAINYVKNKIEGPVFFIFSNDIDWCKENFSFEEAYFVDWNIGEKSFRDMQLMSSCKHNIIANSSFSWWGAWLNNNLDKIIIAPSKWLNDERVDIDDIIPEGWIKI